MENQLNQINNTSGVVGSFYIHEGDNRIFHKMPQGYDEKNLIAAAKMALQGIKSLEATAYKINEIEWEYELYRVFVRKIAGGVLVVIGNKNLHIGLLNLGLNAVIKDIEDFIEGEKKPESESSASGEVLKASFFLAVQINLAREVGPIASMLIDEKLEEMGVQKKTIPKRRALELIDKLAKEIENSAKAEKFKAEAFSLLKNN